MTTPEILQEIISGLKDGSVVPYLGAGALKDVTSKEDGTQIPADSDSLILAMNNGQPMAPRLMYEFPRAAMNQELKKGRSYVERFLTETYGNKQWTDPALHTWISKLRCPYVIDINRDTKFQSFYSSVPHILIHGCARVAGTDYRFRIYEFDGTEYLEKSVENIELKDSPVLFKPMGSPLPKPSYIAADADYVDYITELMGGFAIPAFLKEYRKEKKYLLMGMSLTRDTERMVLSEIIYGANSETGWALIPNATDKEKRYCAGKKIQVLDMDWEELLAIAVADNNVAEPA